MSKTIETSREAEPGHACSEAGFLSGQEPTGLHGGTLHSCMRGGNQGAITWEEISIVEHKHLIQATECISWRKHTTMQISERIIGL